MITTKGDFYNGFCRKLVLSTDDKCHPELTKLAHVARDHDVPRLFLQFAAAVAQMPGASRHLRDEAREVLHSAGIEP